MLRSYQFAGKSYRDANLHNEHLQTKELHLARKFVMSMPRAEILSGICPVCGGVHNNYFYTKWAVDYLICSECRSIFAVCDERTVNEYRCDKEIRELRLGDEYQESADRNRSAIWDDFIEWMKFRSFRFLKKNTSLRIIDVGNRYRGLIRKMNESGLCSNYTVTDSILPESNQHIEKAGADIVFYNDQIKTEFNPRKKLKNIANILRDDGLLVLSARAGSGFDILTLRENNRNIYPYEHILLPSVKGMSILLENSGFRILEITTPGMMDVKYVCDSMGGLDENEFFIKHLLSESNDFILQEFQRFLQKSCMSSFIRVIARKAKDKA